MTAAADRFKEGLQLFVRSELARIDYHALWPSTVIVQNLDGTLELRPDASGRVPGVSAVPIRPGTPGTTIKVLPGARVLLGFDEADPEKPFAALWDGGGLSELTLDALLSISLGTPAIDFALKGSAFAAATGTAVGPAGVSVAAAGAALTSQAADPVFLALCPVAATLAATAGAALTVAGTALTAWATTLATHLSGLVKVK